ncbi:MAG: ABC transporter permease [Myxococcales bacterium]|nr:ABC transporter permease [Myxococcales bacterium]
MTTARDFARFLRRALRVQFLRLPPLDQLIRHSYEAGVGSLGLVTVLIIFAGMGLTVQGYGAFVRFGGQSQLGVFVGIGGVRELYPVMAGIMVGARVGANLAAELANMKISEQVEALEVMSVDPMRYLVAPRLWATALMVPLLCAYSIVIGLCASYFAAVHQLDLNAGNYLAQLSDNVTWIDLAAGVFKGLIFGQLVALIACFFGMRAQKSEGAEGVGVATNRAIVFAAVSCIVVNMLLSAVMYT